MTDSDIRFNPAPGWPAGTGSLPGPAWRPEPQWPPAPADWAFYVDATTRSPVAAPAGVWQPASPPRRRRRIVVAVVAAVAVVGLVAGIGIRLAGTGDGLPDRFAGGTLMSPSEQYQHQLDSKVPVALAYTGKPEDYREYLKQASLPEFDDYKIPVRAREALYGSYTYRQQGVSGDLIFFTYDRTAWTSTLQRQTVEAIMGNAGELYGTDTRCAGSEDGDYYQFCLRTTTDGFWMGATRSDGDAIADLDGLRQGEIAAEMAKLSALPR